MSGDAGVFTALLGVVCCLDKHPDLKVKVVGDEKAIKEALTKLASNKTNLQKLAQSKLIAPKLSHSFQSIEQRLTIKHASEVVMMEDLPADALRHKKDSSMRVAIDLVKKGEADGCVSAGNTGALMATAKFVLKTIDGIARPAICTLMPNHQSSTHVLDLGANLDCSPELLRDFALMGSELSIHSKQIKRPKVGLLNVGSEEIKGSDNIKQTHHLLQQCQDDFQFDYVGFVEGNDLYLKDLDVIVCDGFVGNAILKTSEGLAKMLAENLKKQYKKTLFTKLVGLLSLGIFKSVMKQFDPRSYNGACFLGLQGIVIKSHGNADAYAFSCAIEEAKHLAERNLLNDLKKSIARFKMLEASQ